VTFYKATTVLTVLYEGESWKVHKPSFNVIQAAEIEFIRTVIGCNGLDRIEMKMSEMGNKHFQVMKMSDYRKGLIENLDIMQSTRISKPTFRCIQRKRDLGSPRKP
jgi:hypothetical protein